MSACATTACLPPTETSRAGGLELSLSCSLLNLQHLEQCLAQGRGLTNILKLIPRSALFSDTLPAPMHTQHSFVLGKGAL